MIISGTDHEEQLKAMLLDKVPGLDAETLSSDPVPSKVSRPREWDDGELEIAAPETDSHPAHVRRPALMSTSLPSVRFGLRSTCTESTREEGSWRVALPPTAHMPYPRTTSVARQLTLSS